MIEGMFKRSESVAVLIDGDNLSQAHAGMILHQAAQLGPVTVRRVYGNMVLQPDWDADVRFKSVHARGVREKNNADIRLVIDAMELAQSGRQHAFVIASGDSDFAPLAVWLREAGHYVLGVGAGPTSAAFQAACSHFQRLVPPVQTEAAAAIPANPPRLLIPAISVRPSDSTKPAVTGAPKLDPVETAILQIMKRNAGSGMFVSLKDLGNDLAKLGLKLKGSGSSTWRAYLMARTSLFEVEVKGTTARARPLPILAHLP